MSAETRQHQEPYSKVEFDAALETLRTQAAILDAVTNRSVHETPTIVLRATGPFTVGLHDSLRAVGLLVQNDHIRDAFVTARTAPLTGVNVGFVFAKGEAAAARAHRHAAQKGIRDLDRQLNAGGVKLVLKWTGPETAKSEFQPLLDEFTTRTLDS